MHLYSDHVGKEVEKLYICEELSLTVEEFNKFGWGIIMAMQINGDDERLSIMEALADVYELIAFNEEAL